MIRTSPSVKPAGLAAFLAVVLLTLALFAPALRNDLLLWDDAGYIWQNPHIARLDLHTVSWAFGEYWCNYWAPLTWLSLALDRAIWGLDPVGYHLTNVVLHALNAGMFLLLSLQLVRAHLAPGDSAGRDDRRERFALVGSVLAALVFALHPLRVESVAWATERKDVLALFFGLPAVMAYVRYARSAAQRAERQPRFARAVLGFAASPRYGVALLLFCLSLLSKQLLVTLPAILLILDWFPLRRLREAGAARVLAEKVPFLIASVLATLISVDAQRPQAMPLAQSGVASRVLNAVRSVASYLRLTAWPADASPFYLHPGNIATIGPAYLASAAVLVAITACCVARVRRRPILLAAWLSYLLALVPVLGFTQVGPQAMATRFTYFASLPLALLLGVAVATAALERPGRWPSILVASATALWLVAIASMTVRHLAFWKDDVTLWTRVIDLAPRASGRAYLQRSDGWMRRGEPARALADANEALAIARAKGYQALHELYVTRAAIFASMGLGREAVADYTSALESAAGPARVAILMDRGAAYRSLGEEALAAADLEAAAVQR